MIEPNPPPAWIARASRMRGLGSFSAERRILHTRAPYRLWESSPDEDDAAFSARLAAEAGFPTAFLSGSCVAASRLGGPDLDLVSFGEMFDSFTMARRAAPQTLLLADGDHGYGNAMNVQRTVAAYGLAGAAATMNSEEMLH